MSTYHVCLRCVMSKLATVSVMYSNRTYITVIQGFICSPCNVDYCNSKIKTIFFLPSSLLTLLPHPSLPLPYSLPHSLFLLFSLSSSLPHSPILPFFIQLFPSPYFLYPSAFPYPPLHSPSVSQLSPFPISQLSLQNPQNIQISIPNIQHLKMTELTQAAVSRL